MRVMVCSLLAVTSLGACESVDNQTTGAVIGGVLGGLAGNAAADDYKAVWTIVGAAAGALIGSEIAKLLTEDEKQEMAAATVKTAETGEAQVWQVEETGVSGQTEIVEPAEPVASNCRVIKQTVNGTSAGEGAEQQVRVCQADDGSWTYG